MNSYEKRIWAAVNQLVQEKRYNFCAFMDAAVALVVRETKRSFANGVSVGRGERATSAVREVYSKPSALKAGRLKAAKRD